MAFVYNTDDHVESFAEFQDILDADQRLFDTNEGLSDSSVYPKLIRATERIVAKIEASHWWKSVTPKYTQLNPDYIIARKNDFTELCVYVALSEYIIPIIADFGTPDNAEVVKMQHYAQKAELLLSEIIEASGWYDFDGDGTISNQEIKPGSILPKRIR
jgi:hypothetical protein